MENISMPKHRNRDAGKGGDRRKYDKKKFDACPLWANIEKRKQDDRDTKTIR